jgi:hypothetical protein
MIRGNVKPTEVYNERKGKEWLRGGAAGHVLTDMTSRVTVTEGAEADAALGERGDGLEHCGPCASTGGWCWT